MRNVIRARRLRARYFAEELFADPAWDMLLDLLQAEIAQLRVPVSSLCIAAAVPATTALRWLKTLVSQGLFIRRPDPHDGRRVYVELAPETSQALRRYFAEVGQIAVASERGLRAASAGGSGFGRAVSSAGRASRLHREGRRFEPVTAHHGNPRIRLIYPRASAGSNVPACANNSHSKLSSPSLAAALPFDPAIELGQYCVWPLPDLGVRAFTERQQLGPPLGEDIGKRAAPTMRMEPVP